MGDGQTETHYTVSSGPIFPSGKADTCACSEPSVSCAARNITSNPANDAQPMWYRNTIYFMSDRGSTERNNLWAQDLGTGAVRQVTQFDDFDITFPSIGPDAIVFQKGGRIYLLSLPGEKVTEVSIRVVTDASTLRARTAKADKLINAASVSPTGRRAAFETRGDIVTVPAEYGAVINATRTSGVAERYPRWSPDGKTLAYWSDSPESTTRRPGL